MRAATITSLFALAAFGLAAPSSPNSSGLQARATCRVEIYAETDCSGSILSSGDSGQCISAGNADTPGHAYKISGCNSSIAYVHSDANCDGDGTIQTHYNDQGCYAVNTGEAWNKIWVTSTA